MISNAKHFILRATATSILIASVTAQAAELTIGVRAEINSADPHVFYQPNRNLGAQVYEPLFLTDNNVRPVPGLVVAWKAINSSLYEFKLRPGVKFHNGATLTSKDVKFSIERAKDIKASRTFGAYLRNVKTVEIVDNLTFRIHTFNPTAILINDLAAFGIVSKAAAEGSTADDFLSGKAAIGTGPYKWESWTRGQSVTLVENKNYWGDTPKFSRVTYKFLKNDSTRVAALLSGDVQIIDEVPPSLVPRLKKQKGINVAVGTSSQLVYVGLDMHNKSTPYVTGVNGESIPNPFLDPRVRRAVSLLIDRKLISERIMDGLSTPASQFMPKGMLGHVDDMNAIESAPAKAKTLLREAGYPNGFSLTIHCPNDRYLNDAKTCEAMGQMLSANGLRTKVQTLPGSVYFKRASEGGPGKTPEFAFFMVGFSSANGVVDAALSSLVMTHNAKAGVGAFNRSRYSNPEVDRLAMAALGELDATVRQNMLARATRLAIEDGGIVPIHFLNTVWASRGGYRITPRLDGFTRVSNISHAK